MFGFENEKGGAFCQKSEDTYSNCLFLTCRTTYKSIELDVLDADVLGYCDVGTEQNEHKRV